MCMSPDERRRCLRKKDILQSDLAEALGVKPSTLSLVLDGKGRSRRQEEYIALCAGIDYEKFWGEKPRLRRAA